MTEVVSVRRDGADAARSALASCIAAGGVAIFPADGLYGLACDPLDAASIERIHRIKRPRDQGKASAGMYFSALAMRELVEELGPRSAGWVGALLPGPAWPWSSPTPAAATRSPAARTPSASASV